MVSRKKTKSLEERGSEQIDNVTQQRPIENAPSEQQVWMTPNKGDQAGRSAGVRAKSTTGAFTGKQRRRPKKSG
ncbi:MAG: hypothetical protein AB7O26_09115 [Planctomycetaceae bacterium]